MRLQKGTPSLMYLQMYLEGFIHIGYVLYLKVWYIWLFDTFGGWTSNVLEVTVRWSGK